MPPAAAYFALICRLLFLGNGYLGIRIAIESFPPILLMGGRFLSAGIVILLVGVLLKAKMPSRREFALTSLYGVITLGLGVGTLAVAMQ